MNARDNWFQCPKCGRETCRVTRYIDGSKLYIHEQWRIEKPFPHMLIVESCSVDSKWLK